MITALCMLSSFFANASISKCNSISLQIAKWFHHHTDTGERLEKHQLPPDCGGTSSTFPHWDRERWRQQCEARQVELQPGNSWRSTQTLRTGPGLGAMTLESEPGSCRAPAWNRSGILRRKAGGAAAACRPGQRSSS